MQQAEIGIIGGSGLYAMPGLTAVREERVETPFGEPSDAFVLGALEGRKVVAAEQGQVETQIEPRHVGQSWALAKT